MSIVVCFIGLLGSRNRQYSARCAAAANALHTRAALVRSSGSQCWQMRHKSSCGREGSCAKSPMVSGVSKQLTDGNRPQIFWHACLHLLAWLPACVYAWFLGRGVECRVPGARPTLFTYPASRSNLELTKMHNNNLAADPFLLPSCKNSTPTKT